MNSVLVMGKKLIPGRNDFVTSTVSPPLCLTALAVLGRMC